MGNGEKGEERGRYEGGEKGPQYFSQVYANDHERWCAAIYKIRATFDPVMSLQHTTPL